MVMMICDELPVRPGKLFVLIRSLFEAYVVALMSSAKIYYDWYYCLVIVLTCGIMLPYRNITGDSPLNKTTGAKWQRTFIVSLPALSLSK